MSIERTTRGIVESQTQAQSVEPQNVHTKFLFARSQKHLASNRKFTRVVLAREKLRGYYALLVFHGRKIHRALFITYPISTRRDVRAERGFPNFGCALFFV